MGRKIPGKKHRGVKDPEKQRSKRLSSLKGKINAPPSNPDLQEVPHSVNRIAELKEQVKNRMFKKPQNNSKPSPVHKHNNKKKQVKFQQSKGESDRNFLQRVYRACDSVIHEKAFENKYGVDIKRNPTTGEVEKLVKKPKDELEQLMKKARKNKNQKKIKKPKKRASDEPVLTKSQKRQKKLNEKKQKKLGNLDITPKQDAVKFGEVVHAPPTLSVPRKVAKLGGAPRPGERNLLLKSVIQSTKWDSKKEQSSKSERIIKKTANTVIDKSGKRKNLPNALRRRLEKQQAEIISAYRNLKKQRVQSVCD